MPVPSAFPQCCRHAQRAFTFWWTTLRRAFAIDVMGRYMRTADRKILEESQRVYASAFERVPYPDPEDIKLVLIQVGDNNPRAGGADPREFVDPRLIREIEASGFIKRLYGEQGR